MDNYEDDIQRIKEMNPIEEVILECGYKFEREGGRYWRVPHAGGLVINTIKQRFFWVEKGLNGDVIEWVMQDKGWEFRTTVEWLADRAGLQRPAWGRMDEKALKAHRLRLSVFEVAQGLFQAWLWGDEKRGVQEDVEALKYLRGRGFTDETIRAAGMGFSGRRTGPQVQAMKGELSMYQIEAECPQAAAILGYEGDVRAWGKRWNVDVEGEHDWMERRKIPGMMGVPGIIYAHAWGGRVNYISRRQLPGHDRIGEREWKSYNPPAALVGPRQPYFNFIYRPDASECILVEGPADAESFGQWGWAAAAMCGVSVEDEGMASLLQRLKKHQTLYLCLDSDATGRRKRDQVASTFGPMTRLVELPPVDEMIASHGGEPPQKGGRQ